MSGQSSRDQAARQKLGVLEWIRLGEYEHAEETLQLMRDLGINHLRTGVSWADWHVKDSKKWFDWLIPKVAGEFELLPCFTYTPPSIGMEPKTSAPPKRPGDYADFINLMIEEYGRYFEWVELWNEPNNLNDWDWRLDPSWIIFSEMIEAAAYWARQRGKKCALAGMCPTDPNWLDLLCSRGSLDCIDAVGVHAFPGTWEFEDESWASKRQQIDEVLDRYGLAPQVWLTEVGYSTWRFDEINQIRVLIDVLDASFDRVYWYSGFDLHPHEEHQDGFHEDERHYHFGLKTADDMPKLIFNVWRQSGLEGLRQLHDSIDHCGAQLSRKPLLVTGGESAAPQKKRKEKPVLITGGAGFIGTNLAESLLQQGEDVLIFDNLSRRGVQKNLDWLCSHYPGRLQVEIADVRNTHLLRDAVHRASSVFHLAAQVAVTTSIDNPVMDFQTNVQGTLNILEELRRMDDPPPLLFTSTNKVYGALEDVPLQKKSSRYYPSDARYADGVDENHKLEFLGPYGCSKGAADQYVLDYARTYGIKAVVFRMSCIYGPHQFGNEDQGWVAHFLLQNLQNNPLILYGDGLQVRDILFVGDLIEAMFLAREKIETISGRAFNIGGGAANSISLLELLLRLDRMTGRKSRYSFSDWRQGDQKYYVSNNGLFSHLTGWNPSVTIDSGLEQLYAWVTEHLFGQDVSYPPSSPIIKGAHGNAVLP